MAEFAKEDLDAIVSAIGFGIVSDFRSLQVAMGNIAYQSEENNRLLGNINENLASTDRSLERLEKDIYRQIDARQFSRLENEMEKKTRSSSRKADQILNQIQKSLNNLQKEAAKGNRQSGAGNENQQQQQDNQSNQSTPEEIDDFIKKARGAVTTSSTSLTLPSIPSQGNELASSSSSVGSALMSMGALGAVAGAAYMLMNQSSTSVAALAPSDSATPEAPPIGIANNTGSATQTPTASTSGAMSAATQAVTSATTSIRSKALQKISNKLAEWVSKNTDKIAAIIGPGNNRVFGLLVGGTFSFNKYLTDDSWTSLGKRYVNGEALAPAQTEDKNAAYVAGVVVNLAILSYLACRDIYTKENYRDIESGVVKNFDDLSSSETYQYVKNAGGQIEVQVNKLISESRLSTTSASGAATVGPAPDLGSNAPSLSPFSSAEAATPPASGAGYSNESRDAETGKGDTGSDGGGYGGGSTGGGSTGGGEQPATPTLDFTATGESAPVSHQHDEDATSLGGDNFASISTSGDVLTDTSGTGKAYGATGDWRPLLDYIADSEGADYNTQYSYQRTTDRPLTSLTVAEIMQAQKKQRGSSAIGRYQFMHQTMKDGLAAGIISPEDTFSPETQDRLATWLIESKRKGRAWRSGKLSDERFAQNIAQEWASVPSPYTGKGVYSGQNAKYGVDVLMNTLKASRQSTITEKPDSEKADANTVPQAAQGAIITPLPKSPTDTLNLAPPKLDSVSSADEEDEVTTSSTSIDARPRSQTANPFDEMKNKIAFYSDYMQHHFGYLSQEFDLHTSGELTAEEAYRRAMNPLS